MHVAQLVAAGVALLVVVAIDQLMKVFAERVLSAPPCPGSGLRFEVVRNTRAGLGRFSVPPAMRVVIGGMAAVAGLALTLFAGPLPAMSVIGLGVAIGGGASNLLDMLVRGHIIDFVSIGQWPTFNLADAALCAGLATTVVGLL
jgi:signal peptidase II